MISVTFHSVQIALSGCLVIHLCQYKTGITRYFRNDSPNDLVSTNEIKIQKCPFLDGKRSFRLTRDKFKMFRIRHFC